MSRHEIKIWDERHNLANFAPVPVVMRSGIEMRTSEQAYQSLKFLPLHAEIAALIQQAESPAEAKSIAHEYKDLVRSDWNQIHCQRMAVVIRWKLQQNPNLQKELLNTGDSYIFEDANQYAVENPTESEISEYRRWGIYNGEGENWIGEILMRFRTKLVEESKI